MSVDDCKTYDDDKAFGTKAPSLELIDMVRGEKVDFEPGKVHVIFFFQAFYKGAWIVNEEMSVLVEKYAPLGVKFIALSQDADVESVEKFLKKIEDGRVKDENTGKIYRLTMPYVALDGKKATGKLFATASDLSVLPVPCAYIVNKDGVIVWRQAMHQSHTLVQTSPNFDSQLEKVVAGADVELKNGAAPKAKAADPDEGEVMEVEGDLALF